MWHVVGWFRRRSMAFGASVWFASAPRPDSLSNPGRLAGRVGYGPDVEDYRPRVPPERVERLWRWHEEASAELHRLGAHEVEYLGLHLHVPAHVFPPTPTSDLLGRAVLARTRPEHRVLDMGCGAGANAILAAQQARDVLGVDVNPIAVSASQANAERNGVAERTRFVESDVFDAVDGEFDLIVFDPPFRWFHPRDLLERAFADENYASLTCFMREVSGPPPRRRSAGVLRDERRRGLLG